MGTHSKLDIVFKKRQILRRGLQIEPGHLSYKQAAVLIGAFEDLFKDSETLELFLSFRCQLPFSIFVSNSSRTQIFPNIQQQIDYVKSLPLPPVQDFNYGKVQSALKVSPACYL